MSRTSRWRVALVSLAALAGCVPLARAQVDAPAADGQDARASKLVYLQSHIIPFRSIEPGDDDFGDLQPLKKLIGDRRVVMLGEQSHGDGACFKTKSRLVRFLHAEMGFDVLAWESGLWDCMGVDDAFRKGEPAEKAWEHGIFGIWSLSKEALPAIEYARSTYDTDRPLVVAGFDNQFTSSEGPQKLPAFLADFFDKASEGKPAAERFYPEPERRAIVELCTQLAQAAQTPLTDDPPQLASVRSLLRTIDAHRERLETLHQPRKVALVERLLLNLEAYARQCVLSAKGEDLAGGNVRDKAMGQSLAFLVQTYFPERKTIVWAASMHLTRDPKGVKLIDSDIVYDNLKSMGQWVDELLGDDVYSIMFTAARGEAGIAWMPAFPIAPPRVDSLEELCSRMDSANFLLDLRAEREAFDAPHDAASPPATPQWFMTPQIARPFGYAWGRAVWPRHFDALIFNRDMTKSHRVPAP